MKKTISDKLLRLFSASALALSLCAFSAMPALAETDSGVGTWKVNFLGNKMDSNFTSGSINDSIAGMQPGDEVTFSVNLEHSASGPADWYMSNSVINTLEETQNVAEGGAYSYRLVYTDPDGKQETLYESEALGGEGVTEKYEGLKAATNQMDEYFFIDNMKQGDEGSVDLYIALDGETQGNAYEDTFAKLQLNFAAEPVDNPTGTSTPNGSGTNLVRQPNTSYRMSQTGDEMMQQAIIFCLVGAAGMILMVVAIAKSRRNRESE